MDVFNGKIKCRLLKGVALAIPLSFFPMLARATFLSYFLMFLGQNFELSVEKIGLFFGGFILLSSVLSLALGSIVDRLSIRGAILLLSAFQSAMYLSLLSTSSLSLAFVLCTLLNLAYLSMETAMRVLIFRLFESSEITSMLSIKHTLTDAAYIVGPLTGIWLNKQGISPILLSCLAIMIFTTACACQFSAMKMVTTYSTYRGGLLSNLGIMYKDRSLLRFTMASILLAAVFGQFHVYLGQYLMLSIPMQQMYETINAIFIANALISMFLQYAIGSRVKVEDFRFWICCCVLAFGVGLLGFAFSSNLCMWVVFTIIFTLGEIIIQPLEFLYLTKIAPAHMSGAYYSSQNLTYLGAASTPIVSGFILAYLSPLFLFIYLVMLLFAGGAIIYLEAGKIIQPP